VTRRANDNCCQVRDAIPEFQLGWAAWTAHDGGVAALLAILLVVVILATFSAGPGARRPAASGARATRPLSPYWFLGAVVLGIVLIRFGVNALVVAGGIVLAALRGLLPLLRFLPLFESWRQRSSASASGGHGRGSAGSSGQSSPRRSQRMSRQEALQVFGLDESATREDVQREYRRLMRKVHPDLGGSSYLAAKINEAKDVLS
jgi:hypothetical protein